MIFYFSLYSHLELHNKNILQHILLFVKAMISYMIPDYPEWVEDAISRVQYESKQAWMKEVRVIMLRKYISVIAII